MAKIKAICQDDLEALDLIDRAVQRKHGGDRAKMDNVHLAPAPSGNSRDRALRQLRTRAPELHARVLAGEMTPNAVRLAAGLRRPPDAFRTAQNAWAKMIPEPTTTELARS
jgi:hypothetical protein